MAEVRFELDTRKFVRDLDLLRIEFSAAAARALNKTAFDVLDGLRAEALRAFVNASPRGKQFLGGRGSFRFDGATPASLQVTIYPNGPKRQKLLAEHEAGGVLVPADDRLGLGTDFIAVPVAVARDASGKVPKALAPSRLLAEAARRKKALARARRRGAPISILGNQGRAFKAVRPGATKGVILQRTDRGASERNVVLYALIAKAVLPRIFRWRETVLAIARTQLPVQVARQIERLQLRGV